MINLYINININLNLWKVMSLQGRQSAPLKNALQSLQYTFKSLQFLMFAGNSLKIIAAECLVQMKHKVLEQHRNGDA